MLSLTSRQRKQKFFVSFFQKRNASLAFLSLTAAAPTYLPTPNNPLPTPLPTLSTATPGDGLVLTPDSHQAFSLVFGTAQPQANNRTPQSVRDHFFLNYMVGDLTRAIGSPMDTGQADNTTFATVARHTAPGAPGDLHVIAPDGLHLRAVCANQGTDCTPGHIYGAMIRLPYAFRPGMVIKIRYRSPKGAHSWAPIWMYSGEQISPGPNGNPYAGFNTGKPLFRPGKSNIEIDWNDNYPRTKAGVPPGYQIDFGTPDIYGTHWTVPPHPTYRASGAGYRYYDPSYKPDFERIPFDWSAAFHNLVGNWRNDGSHLIDLFVDGRLIATQYLEYNQANFTDPADGKSKPIGLHLIIGNQAVPAFSPGAGRVRDNDAIPDGWTITVQEISAWQGNIAKPDSYRATPSNAIISP
jgi:hypothetical protein